LGDLEELTNFKELKFMILEAIQDQTEITHEKDGYKIKIWPFSNKVLVRMVKIEEEIIFD
jgi:hypothetical protein